MHTHTVRTRYTFGDRVRYSSQYNGSGTGKIVSICFHDSDPPYYYIEVDGSRDIQGGIMDDEITLLEPFTGDSHQ
jgi:hypothetical protein